MYVLRIGGPLEPCRGECRASGLSSISFGLVQWSRLDNDVASRSECRYDIYRRKPLTDNAKEQSVQPEPEPEPGENYHEGHEEHEDRV